MNYEIKGVDVSRWQGIINWNILKSNINFAVIKIGGSDVGMYPDGQAIRNVTEARANNVAIGFYVYLGGHFTIAEEVAHIINLVGMIGGLRKGEWLALDWEEYHPDEVGYLTGIVDGMLRAGFAPPVIYMSLARVRQQNWQNLVTRNCPLWAASWGNNNSLAEAWETPVGDEWGKWVLWQYSSTGTVAGISGRVDLNYFYGNLQQFRELGLNSNFNVNVEQKIPVVSSVGTDEYTVVAGDNMSRIASRFGRSWQDLWAINRDRVADPNKIYPNMKLRVWGSTNNIPQSIPISVPNRQHVVQNGENLSVIATRYGLPSWQVLYNHNASKIGANPNMINVGLVLDIP